MVVDVELLQINTAKLRDLGHEPRLRLPRSPRRSTWATEDAPIHLSDLEFLNQANWALTIPTFIYDFVKQTRRRPAARQAAAADQRGREGARCRIGDKVPIPVTTFNTAQTVGGNIVPITSFQYQDVGIKIDIEPRVHHNKEVTLKLTVEVSNIAGFVDAAAASSSRSSAPAPSSRRSGSRTARPTSSPA